MALGLNSRGQTYNFAHKMQFTNKNRILLKRNRKRKSIANISLFLIYTLGTTYYDEDKRAPQIFYNGYYRERRHLFLALQLFKIKIEVT